MNEFREVISANVNADIKRTIRKARETAYYRMLDYGLTIAAVALICIKLGCEGPQCMNTSTWETLSQPHLSPVHEWLNLWEIG